MIFKGLGTNVEIDFAHVCASECPVSTAMDEFFKPNDPEESAQYAITLSGAIFCFDVTNLAVRSLFVRPCATTSAQMICCQQPTAATF